MNEICMIIYHINVVNLYFCVNEEVMRILYSVRCHLIFSTLHPRKKVCANSADPHEMDHMIHLSGSKLFAHSFFFFLNFSIKFCSFSGFV